MPNATESADPFTGVLGAQRGLPHCEHFDWRSGRTDALELFRAVALARAEDVARMPDADADALQSIIEVAHAQWEQAIAGCEDPWRADQRFKATVHNLAQAVDFVIAPDEHAASTRLRCAVQWAACALMLTEHLSTADYEQLMGPWRCADSARRARESAG